MGSNRITWLGEKENKLLSYSEIAQDKFQQLGDNEKLFIVNNKHIFYNINGNAILNLSHPKYKNMGRLLGMVK